jgi:uncharacterized delta-60 repeat protein
MRRTERLESRRLLSTADLNAAFGGDGRVLGDFGPDAREHANAVAVQGDGKIVIAGSIDKVSTDAVVLRYNANGSLDASFGAGGVARIDLGADETFNDIRVLGDGKILAGGSIDGGTTALLVRLAANGKPDFIARGPGSIDRLALQGGKIITIAGETVRRYTGDGTLDTSFGVGGAVNLRNLFHLSSFAARSVAVQSDGKIVVAGDEPAKSKAFTLRLLAGGGADASFSGDGIVLTTAAGHAIDAVVQPSGRIVVLFNEGALIRYNANGTVDSSFNSKLLGGVSFGIPPNYDSSYSQQVDALIQQPDGKLLVTGTFTPVQYFNFGVLGLVRLTPNGNYDTTFPADGRSEADMSGESAAFVPAGGRQRSERGVRSGNRANAAERLCRKLRPRHR